MENYRRALKNKFSDYTKVVAERDMIQNKTNIGFTLLDAVERKQTRLFDELIKRHNTLCKEYDLKCEQVTTLYEKNDRLRFKRKQLNNKLNEQEALIKKFYSTRSTLEEDAQKLEYKLSHINKTIDNLKDIQRQTELKLNDMDQEIVCTKDTIAGKMAQNTKLENQIDVEWTTNTSLQATKSDTIIKHDEIIRSLQTQVATVRNQLDEKMVELRNIKRRFDKTQQQYDVQNEQSKELKANFYHLQGVYEKEKCNANKEICSLQENAKSLITKYTLINTNTLYDAQIENGKLKLKLEDQNNTFKKFIANKEHLQQEVNRIKQTMELAQQNLLTERKQRANEIKLHETKLLFKNQEKCKLRIFIRDQVRHIKRVKMEMAAIKPTAVPQSSQTSFTSALKTHSELLYADDQISVIDAC